MRKTLPKHLNQDRKDELRLITKIIKEASNPLMIILFGSYARGDFVEYDQSITKEGIKESYQSDFDILVIVRKKKTEKNSNLWQNIEENIRNNLTIRTPFRMIVDQADFVNEKLKQGRYFYADIYKEGVMLYSSSEFELNKPTLQENLDPKEKLKQAREYYKKWFNNAKEFYIDFENGFKRGSYNKSAFELHQTAETLFNTILLTFTGHTPKVHNLEE